MDAWDDDDWFALDDDFETMTRICEDPEARRELLWLRAMENDDQDSVRSLERVDPGLVARVLPLVEDYLARGHRLDDAIDRREGYAKLWDERLAYHATRFKCGSLPD